MHSLSMIGPPINENRVGHPGGAGELAASIKPFPNLFQSAFPVTEKRDSGCVAQPLSFAMLSASRDALVGRCRLSQVQTTCVSNEQL